MTTNDNTVMQRQMFEMQMEALKLFRSGKSKQQVISIFESRGLPLAVAEIIADSAAHGVAAQASWESRVDSEVDGDIYEMTREIAYRIDEGSSRDAILKWLLDIDMPLSLANKMVQLGIDDFKLLVEARRSRLTARACVFTAAGLIACFVNLFLDDSYTILYVVSVILVALGMKVFSNVAKVTTKRFPHWPDL